MYTSTYNLYGLSCRKKKTNFCNFVHQVYSVNFLYSFPLISVDRPTVFRAAPLQLHVTERLEEANRPTDMNRRKFI